MSIRPTDLQIIVQKTQEVERLQQSQIQQSKVQQQQFAEQLVKESQAKEKLVKSTPHADEVRIHNKDKDAEQNTQKKGKHGHQDSESAEENKENKEPLSDHIIDIKI